jgi:ligand-binding sensor domain-containing protein
MNRLRRWGLLIGLLLPLRAAAATNSSWSVRAWQSDEGLPNNGVAALAQTSDGYLWIASGSRLARFDGVQFDAFSSKTYADARNLNISALLAVPDGLWFGLHSGPIGFIGAKGISVFTNGLPDKVARQLVREPDGTLWINYRSGTIYRLKNGNVKRFSEAEGVPGGYSSSMALDTEKRVWLARSGSLGILRDEQFVMLTQLPRGAVTIAPARSGVWVFAGSQLFKCDATGFLKEFGAFEREFSDVESSALLEDRNGGVWIGTTDSGLFYFNGAHFENIPVSHRSVSSLIEDREANIWAGTDGGGIDRVRPRVIAVENENTGLPYGIVRSLAEDRDGNVWATTLNGLLARRTGTQWSTISTNADWPGGRVTCVAADKAGAVWIGTMDRVLHRLLDGKFTSWRSSEGLASHTIHCLVPAANGDLWIGEESPDVVQRFRDGKFETFVMPEGIRVIRTMTQDAKGDIWIGSSKGYLVRISNGRVIDETAKLGPDYLSIRCLHATTDGAIWIAFADDGLGRMLDGRFANITSALGLRDDRLSQIVADQSGWLWVGGDHGIFKAREEELNDAADGRARQVRPVRYGPSEGLPSLEANFGDSPGALCTRDGRIWMPTRSALAVIDPRNVQERADPPEVMLKRVTVDGTAAAVYGSVLMPGPAVAPSPAPLRLAPGSSRLEFEFTALNLAAPENVRFRYRLDSVDEHWTDADTRRSALYARLPAGRYRFIVTACNGDSIWNEHPAEIAFIIEPFFWQTWWFRFGALGLAAGAVWYFSFRRLHFKLQLLKQQTALDQERARIAKDLHDDLGSRLTKIVLLGGLARRDRAIPEKAVEHLDKISSMSREVIKSLDETVWAANPRNDTLPDLVNYVGQFAVDFLQAAEIKCRLDLPEQSLRLAVPAGVRHNLFLAVKEALNNVVRHSHAKEVRLRIRADATSVMVTIEDDGRGFDAAPDDSHADGLRNMRQRMEEIGGNFALESKAGTGTRISFSCPWKNGK